MNEVKLYWCQLLPDLCENTFLVNEPILYGIQPKWSCFHCLIKSWQSILTKQIIPELSENVLNKKNSVDSFRIWRPPPKFFLLFSREAWFLKGFFTVSSMSGISAQFLEILCLTSNEERFKSRVKPHIVIQEVASHRFRILNSINPEIQRVRMKLMKKRTDTFLAWILSLGVAEVFLENIHFMPTDLQRRHRWYCWESKIWRHQCLKLYFGKSSISLN